MHFAGDVRKPAIEGIAEPAASRSQPCAISSASEPGTGTRRGALNARPVEITFDTVYPPPELPIITDGQAGHRAGNIVRAGSGSHYVKIVMRRAETVAAIDTDIQSGPIEIGRRLVERRLVALPRNIGRVDRERRRQDCAGRDSNVEPFGIHDDDPFRKIVELAQSALLVIAFTTGADSAAKQGPQTR